MPFFVHRKCLLTLWFGMLTLKQRAVSGCLHIKNSLIDITLPI